MGLDMYAFKTTDKITEPFGFEKRDDLKVEELAYWRKFNNLHGWMERLYNEKGGVETFNCVRLLLTPEDLIRLEEDASNGTNLEPTAGFFFGSQDPLSIEDKNDILKFVADAKQAIADGYQIFYSSWW